MIEGIRRNGLLLVGIVGAGLLMVAARPWLISPRGAVGPTILQAESPFVAGIAVIGFGMLATLVATAVGRLVNTAVGLFVLGAGLFPLALTMAGAREIALSNGSLMLLAVETLLLAALVLGAVLIVFRFAGPLRDVEPLHAGRLHSPWGRDALIVAATGALVLPVVWFVARSELKGQVIGAVFLGAIAAGLAGRLLRPNVQPVLLFATPVLFGAVGHLFAAFTTPQPLDHALVAGALSPLSLPMPIDYASGALMGVAVGLGWARSFLHHQEHERAAPQAATAGGKAQ